METDVLIVGAGPTGLALGCQLLRYNVNFVLLDEQAAITPYSKAIGVQARTLEIYEQIDLADELVKLGAKAEKARLFEGGEVRGEIELFDVGKGLSPYPFMLMVEQSKHEHLLSNFLQSHGKTVLRQTELETFAQDETGVTASVKTAGGESQTVRAKYLVGCDGAKSSVRHRLGLTFEGGTLDRLFYVADVEINWQYGHDAVAVCLAQNTITAFFPLPGANRYRVVGTFPENEERREGEILYEEIERQIIADTKLNLDITNVNWFSVYRVHSRRVDKFSKGRCFVAGDAAHIHTPAGGQGMNTGIQDGYNLAWKLAMVLRGAADAPLLETYNQERLANAERLLATTDRMFDFGASDEPLTAFLRTRIFSRVAGLVLNFDAAKNFVFPLISQIGINYRNGSLSRTDGNFSVKAGDRMPFFTIEGASVYERLRQPKFHLLIFSDGQTGLAPVPESLDQDLADVSVVALYPHVAKIFGSHESFQILLRPDNYIGQISSGIDFEKAKSYLDSLGAK